MPAYATTHHRKSHRAEAEGMSTLVESKWVTFNPITMTYDTPDGTSVVAEVVDDAQCFADVLRIAQIRETQRENN